MENVDFGQLAEDYARHRAGFPYEYFAALFGAGFWISAPVPALWRGASPPGAAK